MRLNGYEKHSRALWAGRIGVAVTLLAVAFWSVDLDDVTATVAGARPVPLGVAVAATLAFMAVIALRLDMLLRNAGIIVGWTRVWLVNMAAHFYGLFVPGGGMAQFAIRFGKLAGGTDKGRLAYRMLLDRGAGLAGIALIGLLAWIAEERSAVVAAAAGLGVLAVLGVVVLVNLRTERRVPLLAESPWLVALSLVAQLPAVLGFYLIAQSVHIDLGIVSLAWIRSVALIAAALPISIAGIGIREGLLVILLDDQGIEEPQALAFAVLVLVVTVLVPAAIGAIGEMRRALRPPPSRS